MPAAKAQSDNPFLLSREGRDARTSVLIGIVLSLLLHLLVAALWIAFDADPAAKTDPDFTPLEMVVVEPPAPPPPPPPPPPQAPAPPPPPPPPPAPVPAPEPPPPPPPPQPEASQAPMAAPPPIQRETARTAERSTAPPAPASRAPAASAPAAPPPRAESRDKAIQMVSPDGLLAPAAPAPPERKPPGIVSSTRGPTVAPPPQGPPGEELTQSEIDHLLAQVFAVWIIDYRSPRFADLTIAGAFELRPDGTLSSPFGPFDPWRPERMILDYEKLLARPDLREQRTITESFLGALRQAQPFKRQPDAPPLTAPKVLRFGFRLGDIVPP